MAHLNYPSSLFLNGTDVYNNNIVNEIIKKYASLVNTFEHKCEPNDEIDKILCDLKYDFEYSRMSCDCDCFCDCFETNPINGYNIIKYGPPLNSFR
jgi:hypothetical protein